MRKNLQALLVVVMMALFVPGASSAVVAAPMGQTLEICTPFVLNGAQAGVVTAATGIATVTLNPQTGLLTWDITYTGLTNVTVAHFHGPALPGESAGPVVTIPVTASPLQGSATLTIPQMLQVLNGEWYVNIHTSAYPNGEIRGQVQVCAEPNGPALPVKFALSGEDAGTNAIGTGSGVVLIDATQKMIYYNINYVNLTGAPTSAHFHGPALPGQIAGVVLPFTDLTNPIEGSAPLTDQQLLQVLNREWYANVHTDANPNGEIRGQVIPNLMVSSDSCLATPFILNGVNAGTNAIATGKGLVLLDLRSMTITYNVSFLNLTGAPTSAHFHGPAAPGENADPQVTISDLTSPSEGTAVLTLAQVQQIRNGQWYVNIHTPTNPNGEIRGQVTACEVNQFTTFLPIISR